MEDIHVLHDFTYIVKASGYILAGIGLLGFILFWYYVVGGESRRK